MLRRLLSVVLSALVLVVLFASVAFAQDTPTPAPPASLSPMQWVVAAAAVVVAISGVFKAVAFFLGLLGSFWPKCLPAAAWCARIGTELHTLGTRLGDKIPGSMAGKARAAARRMIPPAMVLVVAIGLGFASSGCAAFASLATGNPVVVATAFEDAANVADKIAEDAFAIAEPLLSPTEAVAAQAAMTKAQATYGDAIAALNDAIKGYEDGTSQNWSALYADAEAAIDAIVSAVDVWGTSAAGGPHVTLVTPAFATARAKLTRAVATVHRYH